MIDDLFFDEDAAQGIVFFNKYLKLQKKIKMDHKEMISISVMPCWSGIHRALVTT